MSASNEPRVTAARWALLLVIVAGAAFPAGARAQDLECTGADSREVRQLDFQGNRTFSDRVLADRVVTTPSSFIRRYLGFLDAVTGRIGHVGTQRCLNPEEFTTDVARLRTFYQLQGFHETKVDTTVRVLNPHAVAVTFTIDEGLPTIVRKFAITGLDSVPNAAEVIKDLDIGVGKRFGLTPFYAAADSITVRLRDRGYLHALVLKVVDTLVAQEHFAEAELHVFPGPPAVFGTVQVQATRVDLKPAELPTSAVVRMVNIAPGKPYSDSAIIDAQRTLYQTGAFQHVEVAPVIDSMTTGADTVIDVHVFTVEDKLREVTGEVGWATLDCFRTTTQYTDKNVFSSAKQLDFTMRFAKIAHPVCYELRKDPLTRFNYSFNAVLHEPQVGSDWTPSYSVFTERRGEYLAYLRTTYIGFDLAATRNVTPRMPVRVGFTEEFGRTQAQEAVLCSAFSRCDASQRELVQRALPFGVISGTYQWDRTDNPFDPRRGTIYRAEARAAPPGPSDPSLSFVKGTGDVVFYQPLGSAVIALRFRGGWMVSGSSDKLPPPQERLYAGGPTSVRGYQQNLLGPLVYLVDRLDTLKTSDSTVFFLQVPDSVTSPDRRIPVGGNTLVVGNLDVRFRSPVYPELLQFTLFSDVGQVWERGKSQLRLKTLRWTPGIALRYFSPVGPIQANVGYNPYPALNGPAFVAGQGSFAPLYCVSPGNRIPARFVGAGLDRRLVQDEATCPASFVPTQSNRFFSKLNFTLSIGPDF
jgi:outer membrane protein assembly factor BamA